MIHHLMSVKVTISFPNHLFQDIHHRGRWIPTLGCQNQTSTTSKHASPSPSPTIIALRSSKCNWMLTFMILMVGSYFWSIAWHQGCRVDSHSKKVIVCTWSHTVLATSYSQKQNFCLKRTPSNLHKNFGCCHVIHVIVPDSDRPM